MLNLYLASQSPARKKLLEQLGFQPICVSYHDTEPQGDCESVVQTVQRLAQFKLESFLKHHQPLVTPWLLVAADTLLECEGQALAKPATRDEAFLMLSKLSGKTHLIHTGMAIQTHQQSVQILYDTARVNFHRLGRIDIESYLEQQEWQNVAGAYRLQSAGATLISKLEGEPSTVIGLSLKLLKPFLYPSSV